MLRATSETVAPAKELPTYGEPDGRFIDGDKAIRGNLVPDAHLAATAIAHGCRLATADRGFARYPGMRWFDPALPPS